MRTYDPAADILYVHLAQQPAVSATPPAARDECHRLPAGYPNVALLARIGEPGGPAPVLHWSSSPEDRQRPTVPALARRHCAWLSSLLDHDLERRIGSLAVRSRREAVTRRPRLQRT